ncbi:malonyl-CoA:anthocyanidin 5-O-glucoside-6''-O-malonyltransferase [Canna indica]|uniref:Malonyl-CoA:anthocyanidin 5-O-glucoside-6''-O-malonyltransferase n=1 Tax=Canna indica TaxID=4628 RepID=A0AAQ3KUF8_9LILI|nr:malonyl-CoA:anthocyanidin 5-O-glucoside-6''-O-malonyltransferase [Canna indica]
MSRVVVKTTYVPLPPSPAPLPDRVDLSLFDALWICFPPIQRLLLFRGSHVPPLPALLDSLRSALSRTLLHYFTLAGKLTYAPASGDVFIDCSPAAIGPGVAFFEAESEGGDLGRLADDEVHDVDAFVQLIPELNATELPAPVFTVQVTRFRGAEGSADQGVALGFAAHHSVVDGRALWRCEKKMIEVEKKIDEFHQNIIDEHRTIENGESKEDMDFVDVLLFLPDEDGNARHDRGGDRHIIGDE